MTDRYSNQKGLTLIELAVVMAVFGLLAATVVPITSGFVRSSRVIGARNTLVADLHYVRSLATSEHTTFQVRFETAGYTIVRSTSSQTIRARSLPTGVTCAATDTATFFGWGLTSPVAVTVANDRHSSLVELAANGSVTHD